MSRLAQVLAPEQFEFGGSTFDPAKDGARLSKQLKSVLALMSDGGWRTLADISQAVNAPEASVSARLRDLRREGYVVDRHRLPQKNGLHSYRLRVKP